MKTDTSGTKQLDDGRVFPVFGEDVLAWSVGLYMTGAEESAGFPRARAVARAMREHRPSELNREHSEALRAGFGVFSGNGRQLRLLLEEEAPELRSDASMKP